MRTNNRTTSPADRAARLLTEVFSPVVLAAAAPIVIGVHYSSTVWAGLGWAGLTMLFSAVIPYAVIALFRKLGRITGDHHIGRREERPIPLLLGVLSVVGGFVILAVAGAPRAVTAIIITMLAVLAGATLVNLVWKLSVHSAVVAGSAAVLVLVFGPALLLTVPIVLAVGWSRVRLSDHTWAQVIVGFVTGAAVAAGVWIIAAG